VIALLPSNPSTLSDTRLKANTWTPETVSIKYGGQPMNPNLNEEVNADLAELLAWDNFERKTSQMREATKAALRSYEEYPIRPAPYRHACGITDPLRGLTQRKPDSA
jgi:hypothetical protein